LNGNFLRLPNIAGIPLPLYKSEQGRFFIGYAGNLKFKGTDACAWASLFNPPDSEVVMHVDRWTAACYSGAFTAELWLNAAMPGEPVETGFQTTTNFAVLPPAQPKVFLFYASSVAGRPRGALVCARRRGAQDTIVSDENGKFIFPPGGSFSVLLSQPGAPEAEAEGSVGFEWWEEPARRY